MTLYEMNTEYIELLCLSEDPEVDPQLIADTMEAIEGEYTDKVENYGKVIRQLEHDAAALDYEAKRLKNRKDSIEASIKRMKAAIKESMELRGESKVDTQLFKFSIRKNPASVVIDDESRVAHDYMIPQPPKIDKKAIKAAIDEGFEFDWAHLEQGTSLSIK